MRLVVWNVRNYQEAEPLPLAEDSPMAPLAKESLATPPPASGFDVPPRKKSAEEVEALVATLARLRPQVLGLVEMGPAPHFYSLQQRLKAAGLDLPHFAFVRGPDRDRHVALLSAFPIREDASVPWAEIEPAGSARYVSRGFLQVVLEPVPGAKLRLWGVHLKSAREEDLAPETIRREEALALRERLLQEGTASLSAPLVVFGDFNDTQNSASLRQIIGQMDGREPQLAALDLEDAMGDRWTHFWAAEDAYTRIDFTLVNAAAKAAVVPKASFIERYPAVGKISDHRALVVTLKLRGER